MKRLCTRFALLSCCCARVRRLTAFPKNSGSPAALRGPFSPQAQQQLAAVPELAHAAGGGDPMSMSPGAATFSALQVQAHASAGTAPGHRRSASDSVAFLGRGAPLPLGAPVAGQGLMAGLGGLPAVTAAGLVAMMAPHQQAQLQQAQAQAGEAAPLHSRSASFEVPHGAAAPGVAAAAAAAAMAAVVSGGGAAGAAGKGTKRTRRPRGGWQPPTGAAAEAKAAAAAAVSSVADGKGGTPACALDDETAMEMVRAPSASQKADHTSLDPKKARRVLANRQSAQRSRLRKLQYISELEKRVNSMQAEAAGVEAQVLEFQQNTTSQATELEQLKQKLNSLQSQMQYKDALFETLKAELDTLRQANVMASTSMSPPQSSPGYLPADPSVATGILPTSMPPALASDVPLIDEKADEGMWPSGALAGELST